MGKDYKPRQRSARSRSGGGLLLGLFLGFLLGLAVAAAIAIYFFNTPIPFAGKDKSLARAAPAAPALSETGKSARADDGKPRFDFYRILPGQEEPVSGEQLRQAAKAQSAAGAAPADLYFLQAGSFQNPADADNLKAKLALLGVEAAVEPTTLADKGTWYRVRVGPLSKIDEINQLRSQLAQNGVDASLVKIRDAAVAATKNP